MMWLTLRQGKPWAAGDCWGAGGRGRHHRWRKIQQVWKLERERDWNQSSQHPKTHRQRGTGGTQKSIGGRDLEKRPSLKHYWTQQLVSRTADELKCSIRKDIKRKNRKRIPEVKSSALFRIVFDWNHFHKTKPFSCQTCESWAAAVAVETDVMVFTPWLAPPTCLCLCPWLVVPAAGDALITGSFVMDEVVVVRLEMLLAWDVVLCPTGEL